MTKCVFCGRDEPDFRGVHLIKNDGSVNYFCSGKCRAHVLFLKRDKRKLKWTESYRVQKGKADVKAAKKIVDDKVISDKAAAAKVEEKKAVKAK